MNNGMRFDDKVALITGAGNGLGRAYALLFASRGARVVVNDLGGSHTGDGASSAAADEVVGLIREAGGEAVANYDSVEEGQRLVQTAMDHFGQIDIVVNNAGILRDTSFAKLTEEDWDLIYRVHVLGAFRVTHAAWPHMRAAGYGRVVFTASAAGIYGNFGQANYAMAKLGLVGLSNTLALEGARSGVHVNTIAPLAGSRMTETVLPPALIDALKPEYVAPLVAWLCHEDCEETGGLFEVGGGFFGKLRWERAEGRMFRVGRNITIEDVARAWPEIAGFERSTHPADVNASLQPILANAQAGPSLGGNALIDLDLAVGYEYPAMTTRYDERDLALYALGVGAADDGADGPELQTTYEMHGDGFRTLPTYGVVPAINAMLQRAKDGLETPGLSFGFDRLLHGEQQTEVLRPLPPKATLTHHTRITDIFDKGKNAVVVYETRSLDEDGDELIINRFSAVIRGAGGWGGERGEPLADHEPPDRKPDAVVEQAIGANQALLYRLSGDWNPLHADPGMARAFGFDKPILHGLCTFGYAARHVINTFCDGDPRTFRSISVRFSDSVFPGETLVTEMWRTSDLRVVFRCKVKERGVEVLSRAAVELYAEIPVKAARTAVTDSEPEVAKPPSGPTSAGVFAAIGAYVAAHPELVAKVGCVYQFKVVDPEAVWTLDLKNGAGACVPGTQPKAECTLELSDADFMDMTSGKADPQQLYFGGKLKISGNVMASQKLEFLSKLDPADFEAAAPPPVAEPQAAPAASVEPQSPAVFAQLARRLADGEIAPDLQARVVFKVRDPDAVWTVDLRQKPGTVAEGEAEEADATVTLDEEGLLALARDEISAASLFQRGRLTVEGDFQVARQIGFIGGQHG